MGHINYNNRKPLRAYPGWRYWNNPDGSGQVAAHNAESAFLATKFHDNFADMIREIRQLTGQPEKQVKTYRVGSKQEKIAQYYAEGASESEAYQTLCRDVWSQTEPMVFRENTGHGGRRVLPLNQQTERLRKAIDRTYKELGEGTHKAANTVQTEPVQTEPVEPKVEPKPQVDLDFHAELLRIRQWVADRAETPEKRIDSIGTRSLVDGIRMLKAGIPVEACLNAMVLHWSDDQKREAGIPQFDFSQVEEEKEGYHKLAGYVVKLVNAGLNVQLIGPTGSGKSTLAAQVADLTDREYRECPLTAGATPSWLLGRNERHGHIESGLERMVKVGGLFNFEEIDAADANMLMVTNQLLANRRLDNPTTGEAVTAHENFRAVSTANTFGNGATRQHSGREKQDGAMIDRWRMGRVLVDYDRDLEASLWKTYQEGVA